MSVLGGIYCFGEAVVEQEMLARLGQSLSARGPDGGRDLLAGQVGFSYRAFHTNRESRLEDQPYVSPAGRILAWDGRLDNREEIARLTRTPFATDVELVMAAYERWAEDFVSKLIGDFALSLWDPLTHKLMLGRDHAGVRSLYYRIDRERAIWSSDLTALLEISPREVEIDEDHIAGFLSFGVDTTKTPFLGFKAIRPGHVLIVDRSGRAIDKRVWALDPSAKIRFKSDTDYEERFRELFAEAVKTRLRSDRPVIAELSGGLDSSSIVCMADRLLQSGSVDAPGLELVSHVTDEYKTSDERRFIHYVEDHIGRKSNYVRQEDYPYLTPMPDPSRISTINQYLTNCGYNIAVKKLMREHDSRVLLSGIGGDELLHSVNDPAPELCELLVTCKFLSLFRRLRIWGDLLREPYPRLLWQKAVLPALPIRFRAAFRKNNNALLSSWLNQDFARRVGFQQRSLTTPDIFGFRRPTGRDQAIGFLSVVNRISTGFRTEAADYDISYPYLHRPLVEFLCAIPFDQLLRPGNSRSLMRRSLAGLLPPEILRRKGKGQTREILGVGFERQWPRWRRFFDDPLVVRYGFVEPKPLHAALLRARHGLAGEAFQLSSILTLEVWLRLVEERKKSLPHIACR